MGKTVRQRFFVSIPKLNVVGCGRTGFEPDGMTNDEGGRFSFRFADFARGLFAAVATVQKFVRQFVHERRELLGWRLARKKRDASAIRSPAGRRDVLGSTRRDILRGGKPAEPVAIFARISVHHANLRQLLAIGLTDIKDVSGAEAGDARESPLSSSS